ncbi:MAG: hypothetical protein J6B50_01450 [Lachnospiraceae bacterium]|nr:hypothetical protein [Lachnospiraceae bacterium]MBP3507196.1 hypothetical protein [Lachnospiraceae bacterium]
MKRKYYLRGIGVGILFATIVLFTAYSISGGKKMSDEEVIKRAEELGMVQAESVLDNLTKPANSTEDDTPEATADTTDSISDTTLGEETSEGNSSEELINTEEGNSNSGASSESTENVRMVNFTVVSGMSSWNVATILRDQGVIEDASDFDSYLVANGYSSRINVGEYSVAVGSDYETIANMLTGR